MVAEVVVVPPQEGAVGRGCRQPLELEKSGNWVPPWGLQQEHSPADNLDVSLSNPLQTSGLQNFLGLFSLPLFSSHSLGCPGVALAPWERKTKLLKGRVVCFLHCFDVGTLPAFIKPSQAQSHRPPGGGWAGAKL